MNQRLFRAPTRRAFRVAFGQVSRFLEVTPVPSSHCNCLLEEINMLYRHTTRAGALANSTAPAPPEREPAATTKSVGAATERRRSPPWNVTARCRGRETSDLAADRGASDHGTEGAVRGRRQL